MEKRCRICRAVIAADSSGRCQGCIDAKTATDAGKTYGKLKGEQYAVKMKQEEEARRIREEAMRKAKEREAERAAQDAEQARRAMREKAKQLREQGKFVCLICAEPLHYPERKYHKGACAALAESERSKEQYHKRKELTL